MVSDSREISFVSVREAGRRLGVHENTVRNWVASGILRSARVPGARFHRFEASEIERVRLARKTRPDTVQQARRIVGPELADADPTRRMGGHRRREPRVSAPRPTTGGGHARCRGPLGARWQRCSARRVGSSGQGCGDDAGGFPLAGWLSRLASEPHRARRRRRSMPSAPASRSTSSRARPRLYS